MIYLYKNNEVDYTKNGSYLLSEAIECIVYRELNGQFKLELIYPINDIKNISKYIEEQMIIKAETPTGYQLFRINTIKKDLYNLTVTAYHISYDLRDVFIDNINILSKNRTNSIKYVFENTLQEHNFKFDYEHSGDNGDLKDFILNKDNLLNFLLGSNENSISKLYGQSEVDFNNYNVLCNTQIGQDKGYLITNNKNLISIDEVVNSEDIITRIMPEGKPNKDSKGLRLEELFVDSEYIEKYNKINFAHIIFDEVEFEVLPPEQQDEGYNERKKEAQAKLKKLAKELYTIDKVDIPSLSITVDFDDLQYNEKYKDIKHLYSLNLGDTVKVKYNKLNIDITNRVKSYEYNALENKYINITLGSIQQGIEGAINRSNGSNSNSNNKGSNDLLSRVEDLENGFSEIEQKWNKVEFRFGTGNINRIKNGAFLAGLDFWNVNNEKEFDYKTLKDEDLQCVTLKIKSTLNYEHKNKGYVLSDELELKKEKDYTLSFKIKLESNVKSATISFLRKANKDDISYKDELLIGTITNDKGEVVINEKYFKDFKTNDMPYMVLKVVNNGLIDESIEGNNNAIFTEFALYEGFGYKGFNYNDALYEGITKIDANGVEVSHSKIKTKTKMKADGFFITDNEDNILGSFSSNLEYSYLYSDYVYASNIKNSIMNTDETWEVDSRNEGFNEVKYTSDKVSKIFNNDFKCAKSRINSKLEVKLKGNINDYSIVEGFDGSDIIIDLNNAGYIGNIELKNNNSLIHIIGGRDNLEKPCNGRLWGTLSISNCKNVIIDNLGIYGLQVDSAFLNSELGVSIDNSNVFFKDCDITGFNYGIKAKNNSIVGVTNLTGSVTYLFDVFNNSHIYIGDGDGDIICPVHALFSRKRSASTVEEISEDGSLVQKEVREIPEEEKPKKYNTFSLKINDNHGEYSTAIWDMKNKKWIKKEEKEKLICGKKDEGYYLSLCSFDLGLFEQLKRTPLNICQATLKIRLKVKSYTTESLPLYMFSHFNNFLGDDKPMLIGQDYKKVGDVYLSTDNYIDIDTEIAENLIYNNNKGLGFGCVDMTEEKVIIIDPKSIEFIIGFTLRD